MCAYRQLDFLKDVAIGGGSSGVARMTNSPYHRMGMHLDSGSATQSSSLALLVPRVGSSLLYWATVDTFTMIVVEPVEFSINRLL